MHTKVRRSPARALVLQPLLLVTCAFLLGELEGFVREPGHHADRLRSQGLTILWEFGEKKHPYGTQPRHQGCGILRWPHREISSSARFRVRGPIHPITAITISIAAAMNTNTPVVPKFFSTPAMTNEVKIAEKRLQE